jgi:uncharacterized membrane protein
MNTLIAGFIGPQEIVIVLSLVLIVPVVLVVFLVLRAVTKSKRKNNHVVDEVKNNQIKIRSQAITHKF